MSSKRHLRRRSCERKIRHATRDAARDALRVAVRRWGSTGFFKIYHCSFCNGYHVGHAARQARPF